MALIQFLKSETQEWYLKYPSPPSTQIQSQNYFPFILPPSESTNDHICKRIHAVCEELI